VKQLWQKILVAIKAIDGIKTATVWNNQHTSEKKENAILCPAVYCSIKVRWQSWVGKSRKGDVLITLYIETELFTPNSSIQQILSHYDLIDKVRVVMSGLGFSAILDEPDENFNHIQMHRMELQGTIIDDSLKNTNKDGNKYIEHIVDLALTKDIKL
jgi:hypothetical protein